MEQQASAHKKEIKDILGAQKAEIDAVVVDQVAHEYTSNILAKGTLQRLISIYGDLEHSKVQIGANDSHVAELKKNFAREVDEIKESTRGSIDNADGIYMKLLETQKDLDEKNAMLE